MARPPAGARLTLAALLLIAVAGAGETATTFGQFELFDCGLGWPPCGELRALRFTLAEGRVRGGIAAANGYSGYFIPDPDAWELGFAPVHFGASIVDRRGVTIAGASGMCPSLFAEAEAWFIGTPGIKLALCNEVSLPGIGLQLELGAISIREYESEGYWSFVTHPKPTGYIMARLQLGSFTIWPDDDW
jgi:hypothetical protein